MGESYKTYRMIHLEGAHPPYSISESTELVTDGSGNAIIASKGALNIVYEYIGQLKKMGTYDDSTIVVMADHGAPHTGISNPLLLVKPRGSTGELRISSAPVCQADVIPTVLSDLGLNQEEKFGRSVYEILEGENRDRSFLYYKWSDSDSSWQFERLPELSEYKVGPQGNDVNYFTLAFADVPLYELGTRLSFGEEQSANPYVNSGISENEGDSTWLVSKQTVVSFNLNTMPQKNLLFHMGVESVFAGEQSVIAKVNNKVVYSGVIRDNQNLEFVIPQKYIIDSNLVVYLTFPDAVCMWESADSRPLTISLIDMYLEETEVSAFGDAILFTAESDGSRYFSSGLCEIEGDFAWSSGTESEIQLFVGEILGDLKGEFCFKDLITDMQHLVISSEGQILFNDDVTPDKLEVSFAIPNACIKDGMLNLRVEYPDAVSPVEIGMGEDNRVLAVAYSAMTFTKVQ